MTTDVTDSLTTHSLNQLKYLSSFQISPLCARPVASPEPSAPSRGRRAPPPQAGRRAGPSGMPPRRGGQPSGLPGDPRGLLPRRPCSLRLLGCDVQRSRSQPRRLVLPRRPRPRALIVQHVFTHLMDALLGPTERQVAVTALCVCEKFHAPFIAHAHRTPASQSDSRCGARPPSVSSRSPGVHVYV